MSGRQVVYVLVAVAAAFASAVLLGAIFLTLDLEELAAACFLLSLVLPPLIAFYGAFTLRQDMRDAIASGFLVAYVLLVLAASGLGFAEEVTAAASEDLRDTLIESFTGLMAVVIAFYFGSEIVIQVARNWRDARIARSISDDEAT